MKRTLAALVVLFAVLLSGTAQSGASGAPNPGSAAVLSPEQTDTGRSYAIAFIYSGGEQTPVYIPYDDSPDVVQFVRSFSRIQPALARNHSRQSSKPQDPSGTVVVWSLAPNHHFPKPSPAAPGKHKQKHTSIDTGMPGATLTTLSAAALLAVVLLVMLAAALVVAYRRRRKEREQTA